MTLFIVNEHEQTYGELGERIVNSHLRVGDIVSWRAVNSDKFGTAVVVKDERNGMYSLFGWLGIDVTKAAEEGYYEIGDIVIPAGKVDDSLLAYNSGGSLSIREKAVKRLTKAQIEELLGYKIEIVGGYKESDVVPSEELQEEIEKNVTPKEKLRSVLDELVEKGEADEIEIQLPFHPMLLGLIGNLYRRAMEEKAKEREEE